MSIFGAAIIGGIAALVGIFVEERRKKLQTSQPTAASSTMTNQNPSDQVPVVPVNPDSNVVTPSQSGIKTAIIATIINVILTFWLSHPENVEIIIPGIYLGFSKGFGKKTGLTYFIVNSIFYFVFDAIFWEGALNNPQRGVVFAVLVTTFSATVGAAVPLGIMWVIRKVRKIINDKWPKTKV